MTGAAAAAAMSVFALRDWRERVALAVVASHGATDLAVQGWYWTYVGACLLPPPLLGPVFYVASATHFAVDVGIWMSSALVLSAAVLAHLKSAAHGLQMIFAYLLVVHVPLHLWRCLCACRVLGLMAWVSAGWLIGRSVWEKDAYAVQRWHQRVVIAHVANELFVQLDTY